jgi:AGZA family xanthine/uracil permease-like MFS transporter
MPSHPDPPPAETAPPAAGLVPGARPARYRWARAGDLNGFFALALDNMSDLVILSGILIGAFGFPKEVVLGRMIPGSAVGVLLGDLVYTWMAFRLARATGRDDVTAMPLGLDTPSTFAVAFGILGPVYLATKDATYAWQVGMAVMVLMGIVKVAGAWIGPWIRAAVPRAGLLGSIAGVALLLIGFLPAVKVFADPVVGLAALMLLLASLLGRVPMPFRAPGALAAVVVGTVLYYALQALGLGAGAPKAGQAVEWLQVALPLPTLDFVAGLGQALAFLPIAVPFALATVIGGIDVTESAAAAGDDYDTRAILLTEGVATLAAGMCGGVLQSTPYIGHPAYKAMGSRAAYTLITALFIGLGGMLGYLAAIVDFLPEAAVAPILIFIGLEITAQAFEATPARHAKAVAVAFLPVIAYLLVIQGNVLLGGVGATAAQLQGEPAVAYRTFLVMGNGFILSALLWGAMVAHVIDRRLHLAAALAAGGAAMALFGVIHSPLADGGLLLPWRHGSGLPWGIAGGYAAVALLLLALAGRGAGEPEAR